MKAKFLCYDWDDGLFIWIAYLTGRTSQAGRLSSVALLRDGFEYPERNLSRTSFFPHCFFNGRCATFPLFLCSIVPL
jgi:hypothetical protein